MIDWGLLASTGGGGYGVSILVLIILLLAGWVMSLLVRRFQKEEPEKTAGKKEG